ncbi:o-succinylbenzoate synthase [Gaoshiqia sp. Z1-71]|uniref:o-succinylbenzoate synthase n=1 Tax=Gaoshiqia hydrogeniformans TaxID=3290090 RepID=UPI003BF8CE49
MIARHLKYELQFKQPAGTSRGVYNSRPVWYLFLEENGKTGIGECAPLPGLSKETQEQVEQVLAEICNDPFRFIGQPTLLNEISSVRFGLEMAWLDLQNGGKQLLFPSGFTLGKQGIPINGLIWMGETAHMQQQIESKLKAGYRCIKLKIGAIDFEQELKLLQLIRDRYSAGVITLRVDANGAFKPGEAPEKLERLALLGIHSIEQPVAAGQWEQMAGLCCKTPVPVALDEELIGISKWEEKERLLDTIRPQFIVLKPSLHGGFSGCDEWIELAENRHIGWWITSYLESDIGLNAIAQWTFTKQVKMHQGLGTGQLFTNNIESPLEIRGEFLCYRPEKRFDFPNEFNVW